MNHRNMFSRKTGAAALASLLLLAACDKKPIGPVCPDPVSAANFSNFGYVRSLYNGADAVLPANAKPVRAIVVSNYKNEANGNYRVQDMYGRGINLFLGTSFTDTALLRTGNLVDINIANETVGAFNGDLQLKGLDATSFSRVACADNYSITPRTATVRQVLDSLQVWASTVVKLENVTITKTSTGTTGTNYNIVDASGSIVTFVRAASGIDPLAGAPTGATSINAQSVTGYVSIFQSSTTGLITPQVILRMQSDVVAGGSGAGGTGITLGSSPLTLDFNTIGAGSLPTGVTVRTGARADTIGAIASPNFSTNTSLWTNFTAGFRNYASATGLTSSADSATQVNATNRALGIRQTGTIGAGGDPGAAFVFLLNNTTGKNNLKMDFQLQSLDAASARTTTWTVDYALGDNPTSFTPVTGVTGTLTTGATSFSNNAISVTLPAAVNNQGQKVWIRVVTLSPSTGSGSRASSAIDDVKFTWN